jgi:ferredoxin
MSQRGFCCPHCKAALRRRSESVRPGKCPACGKRIEPEIAATKVPATKVPAEAPTIETTLAPVRDRNQPNPETGSFAARHHVLAECHVVPEAVNCVQCGTCTHNCPMGIDVRAHAWRGLPIHDSHCLTCAQCVERCPRGVLRFEHLPTFSSSRST